MLHSFTMSSHVRLGDLTIRNRGRLPHWEAEGSTYLVNFRLEDSLPKSVLDQFEFERKGIIATAEKQRRELSRTEQKRVEELFSERVDAYLDAGSGACHLAKLPIAAAVAEALTFFDGERYRLFAWCVMPNHVHVVLRPLGGFALAGILHSWKSFTAKKANEALGIAGRFWQPEYYDHLIRNEEEFLHALEYVARNPEKAGLRGWKWVWARPRKEA